MSMRYSGKGGTGASSRLAWSKVWLLSWLVLGAALVNLGIERGDTNTTTVEGATPAFYLTTAAPVAREAARRTKNIEDVRPGDVVLAWDEQTGVVAPKRVVRVFRNWTDHLRVVTIRGSDDAAQQTLETTNEHPFYVVGRGWVEAQYLERGQQLLQSDNQLATVVSNTLEPRPDGLPVFNFEVQDAHTYFVAAQTSDLPILVHNTCVHGNSTLSAKPQHRYEIMDRITGLPYKTGVGGG